MAGATGRSTHPMLMVWASPAMTITQNVPKL